MKKVITQFRQTSLLMLLALVLHFSANAATFTAVASGNFSSASTWGGIAPPNTILLDQVVIPNGISVNLDQNIAITGALASFDVNGTLTADASKHLAMKAGIFSGSGTITLDSIVFGVGSGLTYTGSIISDYVTIAAGGITTSSKITVGKRLWLASGSSVDFLTNSSLTLSPNATIIRIGGGSITATGGTINLSNNYNVIYNGGTTAGLELEGSGLRNIEVDVLPAAMVNLSSDLQVAGVLTLTQGGLSLNGFDFTLSPTGTLATTGIGFIIADPSSDVTINSTSGTVGTITFFNTINAIHNLNINVGTNSQALIAGGVSVNGKLNLISGTLNFSNRLTINDTITGNGKLYGNANSDLIITASSGLGTVLNFDQAGQTVRDLKIGIASGGSITLGSDLTVLRTFALDTDNQLNIRNVSLHLDGDLDWHGTLTTDSTTGLHINIDTSASMLFTGTNATIGDFTFNAPNNNLIMITGNLTVTGLLNLEQGRLALNKKVLNLTGNIAAGNGLLYSDENSSVFVNTKDSLYGGIEFYQGSARVEDLTINIGQGNNLELESPLEVYGGLALQSGTLSIANTNLTMAPAAVIAGGSANSYVVTNGTGELKLQLVANDSTTYPLGTISGYTPAQVGLANGSASSVVGVRVSSDVLAKGTTGTDLSATDAVVDATWHITSSVTTNLNLNLKVMWEAGLEVNSFDRNASYLSHYSDTTWDSSPYVAATSESNGMFSLQRNGFTSLSPFAVYGQRVVAGIQDTKVVSFNMFPNPTTNSLVISYINAAAENMKVDIMNITGSIIGTYNISSDRFDVPVSELANGTYFARVYNGNVSAVKSFSKL